MNTRPVDPRRHSRNRRLASSVVLGLLLVGTVLVGGAVRADAWVWICKFPGTSITSSNTGITAYANATSTGRTAWNDKATPVYITTGASTSTANVRVSTASSSEDYWARITRTCVLNDQTGQAQFQWNSRTAGGLTVAQKGRVAMHEWGHVQGLGHMTVTCAGVQTVMVQGSDKWSCGWTGAPPWLDDVNGVRQRYGWGPL